MRRSFFSFLMGAAVLLSTSFCFAEALNEKLSSNHSQTKDLIEANIVSNSEIVAGVGPGNQYSQNHLGFVFDASSQTSASGTFKGYVTFPNQVQYSVTGNIGPGSTPVTLQVGPPSLLGNYTVTFVITSLTGTLNASQGPYGHAYNYTNGDHLDVSFSFQNGQTQSSFTFLNRL